MANVSEFVLEILKKNLKNPRFYIGILIVIVIILFLFPYIDANVFYYNRIDKRINNLQEITKLDLDKIKQNAILEKEYVAILDEIENQKGKSLNKIMTYNNTPSDIILLWKFVTGGFLTWLLALFVPFMKTFKNKSSKFLAFILLIVIGGIIGWLGYIIPTFMNPFVNYIGFPLFQIIIIFIIAILSPKSESK